MKNINELAYQYDVVATLVEGENGQYILWIDTEGRMIETYKGNNKQIIHHDEIKKYCDLYHYPIEEIKF